MTFLAFDHRYSDHSLDESQQAFQDSVAKFFAAGWSRSRVRSTAGGTIDRELFDGLSRMALLSMAAAEDAESRAGLVDIVVAAEVAGAALVTFPLAECWAALRLLARLGHYDPSLIEDPGQIPVLAFKDLDQTQMIPWGAVTRTIVGVLRGDLVRLRLKAPLAAKQSQCGISFGSWSRNAAFEVEVLISAAQLTDEWSRCLDDWRTIMASLATGAGMTAIAEAVGFANQRETRGVLIGALQAVAHPLADAHIGLIVARNLARKAAWFADNEPESSAHLAHLAFVQASRAASRAGHVGVHMHGGQGVAVESDVTLAFTRARQWPLLAGDPEQLVRGLGRKLLNDRTMKEVA